MTLAQTSEPAVWLPTVRSGTGTDVFTKRLSLALQSAGIRAEIAWLPHRAEYFPWSVSVPIVPAWANIVHINSWLHERFYQGLGLPIVSTCHGCVHDPALEPYKSKLQSLYHRYWIKRLEQHSYLASSAITAVSKYTAARTQECFSQLDMKIIPNWLPKEAYAETYREMPNEPFRLLYIGSWSRRKGVDLLPEIMARLGNDFELRYTSISPPECNTPPNMTALGWTSNPTQVRQWMASSDALLFPSRMEGMPLAVLEAMACGLPVVCSNAASLPEIVEHGKTGLVCQVDDIDAFVKCVRSLKDGRATWQTMQFAARAKAAREYAEARVIATYLNLYKDIVSAKT